MEPYYQDDAVTIYHGDCRQVSLPAASVDCLITDPPYGIGYVGRGKHGRIVGDEDNGWIADALRKCLAALRFNRHFYVFGPDVVSPLTHGATTELIWDKGKFGLGDYSLPWSPGHERITFGVWNPYPSQAGAGTGLVRLRRSSVLTFPKQSNGRGAQRHPTEKPVPLLRELIEASSRMGEVIFDPFMGSGATLEAARREGRKAIGVEIEERYCEVAARRCAQEVLAL